MHELAEKTLRHALDLVKINPCLAVYVDDVGSVLYTKNQVFKLDFRNVEDNAEFACKSVVEAFKFIWDTLGGYEPAEIWLAEARSGYASYQDFENSPECNNINRSTVTIYKVDETDDLYFSQNESERGGACVSCIRHLPGGDTGNGYKLMDRSFYEQNGTDWECETCHPIV